MQYNSDEVSTTKISDLRQTNSDTFGGLDTIKIEREPKLPQVNTTYQNLNLHPNPFIPEGGGGQYELPGRDIPQSTEHYATDVAIKQNYIPPPPRIDDYLRDTEIITNKRIKKHQEKQKRSAHLMDILGDLQFSIYLAFLFLLFQLPIINVILYGTFVKFNLFFYPDGNLNFYGILLKSVLFGILYFILQKGVDMIVV